MAPALAPAWAFALEPLPAGAEAPAWAPAPMWQAVEPVTPAPAPIALPAEYPVGTALVDGAPLEPRTFDAVEVGRLHQAAADRHQLGWWLREISPLPGVSLATLLARGRAVALEHVVRAIVARAGLLPAGSAS